MLIIQPPIIDIVNSNLIVKYLEGEVQERLASIEVKVPHWEAEDRQNLVLGLNHPLGVSDGPSQNRLKARVSLEGMHIVMTRTMCRGQLSVRPLYLANIQILEMQLSFKITINKTKASLFKL